MKRCEHAEATEERREVVAWVRRLRRLVSDMPAGVRVYAGNHMLTVTDDCADAGEDSVSTAHHAVESLAARCWHGGDW